MAIAPEDPGPRDQGLSRGSRGLPPLTPHSSSGTLPPSCLPSSLLRLELLTRQSAGVRGVGGQRKRDVENSSPPPRCTHGFGVPHLELGAPSPGNLLPRNSWGRPDRVGGLLELGKAKPPNRGQGVAPSLSAQFQPSDRASSGLSPRSWLRGCGLPPEEALA